MNTNYLRYELGFFALPPDCRVPTLHSEIVTRVLA